MSTLLIKDSKSLFFTSDTHFGHKNIIKYCNRPYSSIEEMNSTIVNTWNAVVQPKDTVIHLGDFSLLKAKLTESIFNSLNGKIILVRGNHDSGNITDFCCEFDDIVDFLELKVEDNGWLQHISCMHYPMAVWPRSHYGAWHLHGHSHGSYRVPTGKLVDVGWDVWGKPVSYQEIKDYMSKRPLLEVDHHTISEYRTNASN